MKRYLSIVLNNNFLINKTLIADDSYKLDEYISKNFNGTSDIRQKYKAIIEPFLTEHQDIIKCTEEENNRYYKGKVAILEFLDDEQVNQVRIIYKKHLKLIKQYIKEQSFMRQFVAINPYLFSPYIQNKIKFNLSKTSYEFMIKEWYNSIIEKLDYYEICRKILKLKDGTVSKKEDGAKLPELVINQSTGKTYNYIDLNTDDPDCDAFDPDTIFRPDLDDIARGIYSEDGCLLEDIMESTDEEEQAMVQKVKTYELDPDQLSFFD